MNKEQIKQVREILGVPKEMRLAQFIYNVFSESGEEHKVDIQTYYDGKFESRTFKGLDCFYVKDKDFLSMLKSYKKGIQ